MAKYKIEFFNDHGVDGTYAVFTSPPTVGDGSTVYTNSWMSFPTPPGGDFKITVTSNFDAWVGTSPSFPAPGVVVETGQTAAVKIGTTVIPMVVKDGRPSFNLKGITANAKAGSFGIVTGMDFTMPNSRYMIGLAQLDSNGNPAPTASILANNNAATYITPVVRFFIGEFKYIPGTVVNFAEASAISAKIDFSSSEAGGMTTAIVKHLSTGAFQVKYVA
ncbi:hypothetical protein Q9L58_010215 [Maublancomyces gigas]|uniref:Uncharacterized protein n=1 Tax=Discina gigas TaxID=1032678 RepID=A0ABR3G4U3_9PEZI